MTVSPIAGDRFFFDSVRFQHRLASGDTKPFAFDTRTALAYRPRIQELRMPAHRFADLVVNASPLLALLMVQTAAAQTVAAGSDEASEQVVVTGTRVENRTLQESTAPVDVLSGDSFRNLGVP